jgi:hypothetical protein
MSELWAPPPQEFAPARIRCPARLADANGGLSARVQIVTNMSPPATAAYISSPVPSQ